MEETPLMVRNCGICGQSSPEQPGKALLHFCGWQPGYRSWSGSDPGRCRSSTACSPDGSPVRWSSCLPGTASSSTAPSTAWTASVCCGLRRRVYFRSNASLSTLSLPRVCPNIRNAVQPILPQTAGYYNRRVA